MIHLLAENELDEERLISEHLTLVFENYKSYQTALESHRRLIPLITATAPSGSASTQAAQPQRAFDVDVLALIQDENRWVQRILIIIQHCLKSPQVSFIFISY